MADTSVKICDIKFNISLVAEQGRQSGAPAKLLHFAFYYDLLLTYTTFPSILNSGPPVKVNASKIDFSVSSLLK